MTLLRSTADAPVYALCAAYALAVLVVMLAGFTLSAHTLEHTPRCGVVTSPTGARP